LRGGFVLISLLDQSFAAIDLAEVLRSTGDLSTISTCFDMLGINIGGLDLPGNLLLPDVIRQNWNSACSGHVKMSVGMTTFRVFTNTPNITRKIQTMGASVVARGWNVFGGLNIAELPITMTAIGSDTVNIGPLVADVNYGDVGGGVWGPGTMTPVSVPFEFDFRAAPHPQLLLTVDNLVLDEERVRMGVAADPDYGDPNRAEGADHSGQFYVQGEQLLMIGARAGADGLWPMQLKMVPDIDDAHFTVFRKALLANPTVYTNIEPWGASSTDTHVISAYARGINSTSADPDVNWSAADYGLVNVLLRGFIQDVTSAAAAIPDSVPGSTASVQTVANLEAYNGQTVGMDNWLPLPEVTNPAHDGYYVPPQTDSAGHPINRNGQMLRGTAVSPAHDLQRDGYGAGIFTLRNPVTNVTGERANVYTLELNDPEHIANDYNDPVRGRPDNTLWRIYGEILPTQATLTVTLPFIQPRAATINGTAGIVPDPLEAGNFTGQTMEWSLIEYIMDTEPAGLDGPFFYRNFEARWIYDAAGNAAGEDHQFIWQD
jgi:hypothetical protein